MCTERSACVVVPTYARSSLEGKPRPGGCWIGHAPFSILSLPAAALLLYLFITTAALHRVKTAPSTYSRRRGAHSFGITVGQLPESIPIRRSQQICMPRFTSTVSAVRFCPALYCCTLLFARVPALVFDAFTPLKLRKKSRKTTPRTS